MTDEDDPSTVIVVGEVVAERGENVPVGDKCVGEDDPAGVVESAERDLAVDR